MLGRTPSDVRRIPPLTVVVIMATALIAACGGDDEAGRSTTSTEPPTGTDTTTTVPESDDADSEEIVVVGDDGRVVVLDAVTGDEQRVLLDGVRVDDPAKNGIAVSPGGDVFVAAPGAVAEDSEIVRVPIGGGEPAVVAQGRAPAVSPDGTTLAYTTAEGALPPEPFVVLHDLATGEERELRRHDEPSFHFIGELVWIADGTELAFTAGEIKLGVHIVSADAASLDEARRLGPEARGDDVSWRAIAALDDERLAVVETCCDVPDLERWHVIAVHVTEETVEGSVLPDDRVEATWLHGGGDGRLLVVVRGDEPPLGATLLRWTGDGALHHVADAVVVAAW